MQQQAHHLHLLLPQQHQRPIQTNVGNSIDLDINVDPGSSLVTFIRYQVTV